MDFRGRVPGGLCCRDFAPKESFTPSQLDAISSVFMFYNDFHGISYTSGVGCLAAFVAEMLPLKKPVIDPIWLFFCLIFMGFKDFHNISWISGVGFLAAFVVEMLPLTPLLDSSWRLFL